jgi:hypothetical protein
MLIDVGLNWKYPYCNEKKIETFLNNLTFNLVGSVIYRGYAVMLLGLQHTSYFQI